VEEAVGAVTPPSESPRLRCQTTCLRTRLFRPAQPWCCGRHQRVGMGCNTQERAVALIHSRSCVKPAACPRSVFTEVNAVRFGESSALLGAGCADGSVYVFDARSGSRAALLSSSNVGNSIMLVLSDCHPGFGGYCDLHCWEEECVERPLLYCPRV
jgi:hypothetical protein